MGSITSGVGLISGIDIASLIDSLITLESQGKFRLQDRIGTLQAQQSALLDVNARLLAFKSAAGSFRSADIFKSVITTSSNPGSLTASASNRAVPGSYKFIVRQLVSSSQKLSRGFATDDATPLGLDDLSFEFGNGRLTSNRALEDLNGGDGVDRGTITITDDNGDTAEIDLTDVTTVDEVLRRINDNADVAVVASVEDDHLVVSNLSGSGNITISDGAGDTTATDLGIAGTSATGTVAGSDVYAMTTATALSSLNDGNGVLIRNNVDDLVITDMAGTVHRIDFGRIDVDITNDTLLADLNNGDGVSFDGDPDTADIGFVTRDGETYEFDLTGITTVQGLRDRVAIETEGKIDIVVTDGDHLTVVDSSGGDGLLRVTGAGVTGTAAAEDLGILNEDGVDAASFEGEIIPNAIDQAAVATIGDVIDRINSVTGGAVVASIAPDGKGLRLTDTTGAGDSDLIVASTAGNPMAAAQLGIETGGVAVATFDGERLFGSLGSVLTSSILGGQGLAENSDITVTDRLGNSFAIANLESFETMDAMIAGLNAAAAAAGPPVQVSFALNDEGNGIEATDTSGGAGNLTIAGAGADALGLTVDDLVDSKRSDNLQLQYVSEATRLEDLNYGRGVGTGGFTITDGLGNSATISVGSDAETLYDVITEINSRGLAINARVNDNGDGLIIEEDLTDFAGETPFVPIKVAAAGGTAAADLNILGASTDVEGGFIDGSYERSVDLDASDTLEDIVAKINDAGIPVSATVINTGAGGTPFRLSITSEISGSAGDLIIDTAGVDLGLSTLTEGRDAKVFFGADDPADAFLITSTSNTISNVVQGLTIDLLEVSDEPITVTVAANDAAVVGAMNQMVDAFNSVVERLDEYDFYDTETEQRGLLLGDPTIARIRSELYRVGTGRALNVDGPLQYLTQIGIGFDSDGTMTFDDGKFREMYESDPAAVEALVAEYDVVAAADEEIAEGVTVSRSGTVTNALGFANLFESILTRLTDSIDGVVPLAEDGIEGQIDRLNDRIETIDARLDRRRDQLLLEFTAMETALARLQEQSSSLGTLSGNVALSASLLGRR